MPRRRGLLRVPRRLSAFVAIGANLGDREATIGKAVAALASLDDTRLVARSSFYESAPIGSSGGDYLNAVVELETALEPHALLRSLQAIENQHGRVRPYPNAPRTLDLDLLLFGDVRIESEELTVPHPRLAARAFVLHPLAEIAPDLVVPGLGAISGLIPAVASQRIAKLDR